MVSSGFNLLPIIFNHRLDNRVKELLPAI